MHLHCPNNNLTACCTLHPCVSCSWCRLLHQKKVKALNVVIVEGLTQSHFYEHYLSLPHLASRYTTVSNPWWRKVAGSHCLCFEIIITAFLLFVGIRGSPWLHHVQAQHQPSSAANSLDLTACCAFKHMVKTVRWTKVSALLWLYICNTVKTIFCF